ncbi:helix-turn-helix domain-containing protein [Niabella hibiscisoli]|uniref:helix-turn-helix domain-containing protein n=1 Tax=Niabella hibiscisoli TaxID=1825928 RepID=UPI001F1185BF|nr:helix-turn-helix transcriptional regulator [Niabella hibiscisoli]MCH5719724.1 helix-turn-helix transcriptional regulator [Niabella hibiscisoli]
MKKEVSIHQQFASISEAHRLMGLPQPKHPLISLINGEHLPICSQALGSSHVLSFYKISFKPPASAKLRYGQDYYDFNGGGLMFAAPQQVIGGHAVKPEPVGNCYFTLLIHPDFFLGHALARTIKQYGFFSYTANEALHLSDEEQATIFSLFAMMDKELQSRIDDFSQEIVIAQVELLLNFANRFYKRQFITRKIANNSLLEKLETLLENYFTSEAALNQGLPTVAHLAGQLNISPSYLSDMLRAHTGQNAQQHIHARLIEKAKEMLSTTNLSISEVAYMLGFEYAQSFSKLFKTKTSLSPLEFRQQFN